MYFGIAETVNSPFDPEKITDTFQKLSFAHPFLRALLGYEENSNRYYHDITDSLKAEIIQYNAEAESFGSKTILDTYQRLTAKDWDLRREGMLKVVFWNTMGKTCALFVFHHLLADGRAAQHLAAEFARIYVYGGECEYVPEHIISDKSELPSLPFIGRMIISRLNNKWQEEKHIVTYDEYYSFANEYLERDRVIHKTLEFDEESLKKLISECKENGVSVNDYLLAKMMIEDKTNKIVIAQDIRSKLKCWNPGALGNYSTAMSIVCKPRSNDIMREAKRVRLAVKKRTGNPRSAMTVLSGYALMNPGLIDAVAISTLGKWPSKAGAFVGSKMFGYRQRNGYCITNLGAFEEAAIDNAMFIPPASPAMKKTLGILTLNGKMVVCSSERE